MEHMSRFADLSDVMDGVPWQDEELTVKRLEPLFGTPEND